MTNGSQARRLLAEAQLVAAELCAARAANHANLAVRRAQEVVELAEKAVLLWAGRDYPRVHDVGGEVVATLADRGVALEQGFAEWLVAESAALARKRAPAFYGEAEMAEADAERATTSALRVLDWALQLVGPAVPIP